MDVSEDRTAKVRSKTGLITALLVVGSLVIGTLVVSPYFLSEDERDPAQDGLRMIHTHDMPTHLVLMEQFDKMLKGGALYPRWLSDINKGYGNPTMNFYPPGFYYLTTLINLIFADWVKTMFVISALGLAGSGLALYFLARQFYGRFASAIAALFYMVLPYHVLELYWRGAMPEYIGFIIIPLILYFAFKTGARGRASDHAGLGLLYGVHLITHFPVSYLFTYLLALYAVVWAARAKDLKIAIRIAAGMGLGLLMGAIYWLPAAVEAKYTQEFISETFPYEGTLLPLPSTGDIFDNLINQTFSVQTAALLALVLILVIMSWKNRSKSNEIDSGFYWKQNIMWSLMGIISTFMTTDLAAPLTRLIPKLQATVPAWRWLAIASVFTALALAAATDVLIKPDRVSTVLLLVFRVVILGVVVATAWFTIQKVIIVPLAGATLKPLDPFLQSGFTPKGSVLPHQLPDTEQATLRPAVGAVGVIKWEPLFRVVEVSTGLPVVLRLKTYQFPGWEARINGDKANLLADSSGVQIMTIPPGRHRVEVFFANTPPRTIGALSTTAALVMISALFIYGIFFQSKRTGRGSARINADN